MPFSWGHGGRYLSSRGEEERKWKRRIIFEDEKYLVSRKEKEKRRKRRTIFEEGEYVEKICIMLKTGGGAPTAF